MSDVRPQTISEITRMLRAAEFRPSRGRGQNFLIDGNLMRLVVQAAELTRDDLVLEVGTGTGSLTRLLAGLAGEVVTVEIESILARMARDTLEGFPNVALICADVLAGKNHLNPELLTRLEAASRTRPRIKLVANLPYSIATPLIVNLLFEELELERMVFTVQREVADRLTARPGTRDYGWGTVVVRTAGEAKVLRRIPCEAFWPEPKVDSALVLLRPRSHWKGALDVGRFRRVGPLLFQQRRKTVLRILRSHAARTGSGTDAASVLDSLGVNPKTRGDQLTPEEIVRLSQSIG